MLHGVDVVTVVPVRGRSATGWMVASTRYAVGGLMGLAVTGVAVVCS